jgi:chromosome segregation ATPase
MVLDDGFKHDASRSAATDQLLEEYLRVINDKDDQLHRLLRQLEDQQTATRQGEEVHKARLKELAQQLRRKEAKVSELQQQCSHDEELNGKLVHHAETLKQQLQSSEDKTRELTENVACMADTVHRLEDEAAALRSTVAAAETQMEKDAEALASAHHLLGAERDTTAALRERCLTLTQALEERRIHTEQLEAQLLTMMPRSEHAEAIKALEGAAKATQAQHVRDIDQWKQTLQRKEEEVAQCQQCVRSAQGNVAELTNSLHTTSATLDKTRQELSAVTATAQHREKELLEEVSRRKVAQQELTERVAELQRAVTRANDVAQSTAADLQAAQLQHERYKAGTEKALEAGQHQLRSAQERLQQAQAETESLRRRFETRDRAAADGADTVARLQAQLARVEAEAREKVATLTATAAAMKDGCERFEGEWKKSQAALQETQRRSAEDERALQHKFEELEVAVRRLQLQLRDKEEEVRRAELVHHSELQKLKLDAANAMEEARRRHEAEVRDFNTRIERFRADLGEQAGGSKGLERELQHLDEARREMRREADRLQNTLDSKEAALHAAKEEAAKQQAAVAQLTQRLTVLEREEAAVRQRLEEAERGQLDWKAAAERAQGTVAALKEQGANRDAALAGARREVEELLESRQVALKEGMQLKAQREQLVLKLSATEERLSACESHLRDAGHENKRLQRVLDECAAEGRRARDAADQREAECLRLTRHTEEVEALAKRTSDDLRRSLEERDHTIRELRSEQATLIPCVNEEKSKSLVLQEKLQHEQEKSRRDAEAAEERVRALIEERAAREAELGALRVEKEHLEQQLCEATSQVDSLRATLESREQKYQQRKEEVQKALRQVEEVKAATATTLQEAAAQSTAADALRDKYKKEKAKMETMLQRMEHKVRESAKVEREGRQREESLTEKLKEAEEALRRVQDSMESRVSETKLHFDELCRKQEESFREAASDAQAAEKKAKALQAQLLEAQRRATTAESGLRELQRHFAADRFMAAEEYAEEAVDIKKAHIDAVLRAHRSLLSQATSCVREGWSAVQRAVEANRSTVAELERQLARMAVKHREALQAVEEAHVRRHEALAAEHQEEVTRLRRELEEAERRSVTHRDAWKRTDDDRDQRCHALEHSLERLRALLDLEKEQAAAYRERVSVDEAKRCEAALVAQEERRALERSYNKLKRQLDDRAVERQHNEDELREQRAEVTALQRVLGEKEREYSANMDRIQKEMAAVAAARDAAIQQRDTLQQQLDFMRGQLESARASHQRVLHEQQTTQRTCDARWEAAQAELATMASERRRLQSDLSTHENRVTELVKEVQALRRQEADLLGQLQARKSEISALRERCANLESLKNISEATLAETQTRERDLMDKIEELRNAQQLMQLCFDKQQEQLEIGKRLRQQGALMRSRNSP